MSRNTTDIEAAGNVACPECEVLGGEPCRGHEAGDAVHVGRVKAGRRKEFLDALDGTLEAAELYIGIVRP